MNSLCKSFALGLIALASVVGSGCSEESIQARGFVLPDGDAVEGENAFKDLNCHQCHTVSGVTLPTVESWLDDGRFVKLGGSVTQLKTYGDLVTSVIHPSYRASGDPSRVMLADGSSKMPDYGVSMTVQEMIDIIAFLHPKYDLVTYGYTVP